MDWDVLIPILMFLFPLVVSILDKRAKKRKGVPPVKAEPLFPPAEDIDQEERAEAPGRASDYPAIPLEGAQEAQANETKPVTEGQRAVKRHIGTATQDDDKPKLEIDKKKLILYSEILKPKFDA